MSDDDPRGHGDGDIATGDASVRADNLRLKVRAFVVSLEQDEGYSGEEIIAELLDSVHILRRGHVP